MRPKILLVDNDLLFRESVKSILRLEKYDVLLAQTIDEALVEAKKRPDLAIVDLRLQDEESADDTSGLNLIQDLPPRMPVIILSANEETVPLRKIINFSGGRVKYLFKGEEDGALLANVAAMLAARKSRWRWIGWILIVSTAAGFALIVRQLWDPAFAQGVFSSLVASALWLFGGFLIRRTTEAY